MSALITAKIFIFIVFIALLTKPYSAEVSISAESTNEFVVVSTSPRPSAIEEINNRLTNMEKQIHCASKTEENHSFTMLTEKLLHLEKTVEKLADKLDHYPLQKSAEISNKISRDSYRKSPIQETFPRNCKEAQHVTNVSGIYLIQPNASPTPFLAVCDMKTRGGGWTYFLHRFDGSQEFYLDWQNYKHGFGNLGGEFWLGLKHLHQLTGEEMNELLIELVDWDNKQVYAHYDFFSIGSEEEGYPIKVLQGYSGDAGDSFSYQGGNKFSTKDKDQDGDTGNCAKYHTGGWWYKSCMHSHLTGKYMTRNVETSNKYKIMYWEEFHGPLYSLKEARMMVRPRSQASSPFHLQGKN